MFIFLGGGLLFSRINLLDVKSAEQFSEEIKKYVHSMKKEEWVLGGRWDHERWKVRQLPNKKLIDEFTKNNPLLLSRTDGHMAIANSLALKLAKIDKNTPNPQGGFIQKDENGELTGILVDSAISLVAKQIPALDIESRKKAILKSIEHFHENGTLGIQDMSTSLDDIKAYEELLNEKKLNIRIASYPLIELWEKIYNTSTQDKNIFKVVGVKGYSDGSLGATSALFFDSYADAPESKGISLLPGLEENIKNSFHKNLQIAIHAIGDKANDEVLKIFHNLNKSRKSDLKYPFRIEHVQHLREEEILEFSQENVIASMQPWHLIDDSNFAEKRLGKERLKFTYAFRSLLDAKSIVVFGSDWPVAPMNPLHGIWAAVTNNWIPSQRIKVEEAIDAYTLSAAKASLDEDVKGSLEVGKLADFIVLSENILTIPAEKIKDVKVDLTIFNGKMVRGN